jgi:predicted nucleotidyltransferase
MNVTAVQDFLVAELADAVAAAFIYGSVAGGRSGPSSDIDCFVITHCDLPAEVRTRVAVGFTALQRSLGFVPDPEYPIEVFSVRFCDSTLRGPVLERIVSDVAIGGVMDSQVAASDEVEVLRALLDQRIVVRPGPVLADVTSLAWTVVRRSHSQPAQLLKALGLNDPPVPR